MIGAVRAEKSPFSKECLTARVWYGVSSTLRPLSSESRCVGVYARGLTSSDDRGLRVDATPCQTPVDKHYC